MTLTGLRTFTHLDRSGQLYLAHWCDEDEEMTRFLVVPFTEPLVHKLKEGDLTLRDSLDQPRLWVLEVAHSGDLIAAWIVRFADLPSDLLPHPGTMLLRCLEPQLSLRAGGEQIPNGRAADNNICGLGESVPKDSGIRDVEEPLC